MLAADPHVGEEHKAAIVQHGALAFLHAVQLLRQIGILAEMEADDALILVRIVVVRGAVMALLHIEEGVDHRRKVAGGDQRGDLGLVGLEGDGDDVAHQFGVLAQIFRQAAGRAVHHHRLHVLGLGGVVGIGLGGAHQLDTLLHITDGGEELIHLVAVGGADLAGEILGAVLDAVEHAEIEQAAAIVEQIVPGERGIDFDRHRRIRRLPGQMRGIGQAEIGFVIAGHRLFAGQHDGGLRRVLADMGGDHLVDADAGMDQRALGDVLA